jgi:hypothetical protein
MSLSIAFECPEYLRATANDGGPASEFACGDIHICLDTGVCITTSDSARSQVMMLVAAAMMLYVTEKLCETDPSSDRFVSPSSSFTLHLMRRGDMLKLWRKGARQCEVRLSEWCRALMRASADLLTVALQHCDPFAHALLDLQDAIESARMKFQHVD